MSQSFKDAIEKLSKGKPTKLKIGSRAVPHRLNKHERGEFELAKKKGYLSINERSRSAIQNTWYDYNSLQNKPTIIHFKGVEKDQLKIISPKDKKNFELIKDTRESIKQILKENYG